MSIAKIKYSLSAELADFMGKDSATRPEVTKALWAYIKGNSLNDGRIIYPDDVLGDLVGNKSFDMMKLMGKMKTHFGERI